MKILRVCFLALILSLSFLFPVLAQEEGGGGPTIGMSGAAGATVINGETYQSFSLRPDIGFGKIGIGLDLTFYFDADGNLLEDDWDEGADIIDKIYYVRYGKPGDPIYARVGSIDDVTLGYGLIMRRYSNAIEWPQVRRIGLHTQINQGPVGFEGVVNNFREIDTPGVIGGRLTYELKMLPLPVVFGGTFMHDGNQYLGAQDSDDDDVADVWDMYPGENDDDHIAHLHSFLTPAQINELIAIGDLPDINNLPARLTDLEEDVSVVGIDVGLPLIRNDKMNLWFYSQYAKIMDFGAGYTVPGLTFNMGPVRAGVEYRIFEEEFMPEFFNYGYEIERLSVVGNNLVTKKQTLEMLPAASGYYADLGIDLWGYLDVYAAYQQMKYEDTDNVNGDDIPNKSLFARAKLNTDPIPKISLAEAYYQQPRADDVFDTESEGTTLGYRVGFDMGSGLMLVFDKKTIYRNGEPNRLMTIETVFRFK